jgi:hypothetical protein
MTAKKSCVELKRKTWWIVPADVLHVAPSGDLRVHELHVGCWCEPTPNELGEFIHHALDGRVWDDGGGPDRWAL